MNTFRILIVSVFLLSSCGEPDGFHASYIIPSPDNSIKVHIGSKFMNHWIQIKSNESVIFDEELYFDGTETGIADFQWYNSQMFAVKICGYDELTLVKVYDMNNTGVLEIESREELSANPWIKFEFEYSFNDKLDKYRIDPDSLND